MGPIRGTTVAPSVLFVNMTFSETRVVVMLTRI